MEGVVDKGTMDFSQTLSIGHASLTQQAALEKDWANVSQIDTMEITALSLSLSRSLTTLSQIFCRQNTAS